MKVLPTKAITKTRPRASFLVTCFLIFAGLQGCAKEPEQLVFNGATLGTTYLVKIVPGETVVAKNLADHIDDRLKGLDATFSTYQKSSELMNFNQSAINQPVSVSPDMLKVMTIAMQVYQQSDGAFDPTVGPLVNLWGFGPNYTDQVIPQAQDITHHLLSVGLNNLLLNQQAGTATRQSDIQLDLSAIAKGYAVDAVAELLASSGLVNYLVEVGGELRLSGRKANGQRWKIAIEKPSLEQGNVQQAISVEDMAVATSGDYRNYFEKNGKRYSHTIDPRTGYPIDHGLASVTVVSQSAVKADALATAMMVMGPEKALRFTEQNNLAAYLLIKEVDGFKSRASTVFTQDFLGE